MQRLEVSGAVRPIYASLGFKGLIRGNFTTQMTSHERYKELQPEHRLRFLDGNGLLDCLHA